VAITGSCVSVLGEGIFHQLHGGTTTNVSRPAQKAKVEAYHARYGELRGRRWQPPQFQHSLHGTIRARASVRMHSSGITERTIDRLQGLLHSAAGNERDA
jgi:hypothetical protein